MERASDGGKQGYFSCVLVLNGGTQMYVELEGRETTVTPHHHLGDCKDLWMARGKVNSYKQSFKDNNTTRLDISIRGVIPNNSTCLA